MDNHCPPPHQAQQLSSTGGEEMWGTSDPLPKVPAFTTVCGCVLGGGRRGLYSKYLLVFPRAQFQGPESMTGKSGEHPHSQGHTHTHTPPTLPPAWFHFRTKLGQDLRTAPNIQLLCYLVFIILLTLILLYLVFDFWPHPQHEEVPRLRTKATLEQ